MKEESTQKIKLDQEGYNEFLKMIKNVEKELADLRKYKGEDAIFQGDNWHDNPTLYQAELNEKTLMVKLANLNEQLKQIEIITKHNKKDAIDINDVVKLELSFSENDKEEITVKLIGGISDSKEMIEEVSLNSPLGKAIYKQKINSIVQYQIQNNTIKVLIKEKLNSK